jgi:hypothetical protein
VRRRCAESAGFDGPGFGASRRVERYPHEVANNKPAQRRTGKLTAPGFCVKPTDASRRTLGQPGRPTLETKGAAMRKLFVSTAAAIRNLFSRGRPTPRDRHTERTHR